MSSPTALRAPSLRVTLAAILVALVVPARARAQLVPVGSEFQVNSYTTSTQTSAAVAADPAGNFVVAWRSFDSDVDVFAQRRDSSGNVLGADFQVNTYTTSYQYDPAVAVDDAGNFVVVWTSAYQDGSDSGVFGQRYDSVGTALGGEFQVNTATTGYQAAPAIAANAAGGFVVTWVGSSDGSAGGVFAQRYDSAGAPEGGEFLVNTYTTGGQSIPAIAADAAGNFVVTWFSAGQDGDGGGIFAQRYDSTGASVASEFQVNTDSTGFQTLPAVAVERDTGAFAIVWFEAPGAVRIRGQRYDGTGSAIGSPFAVHTYTAASQIAPAVAMGEHGDFVVVWQSQDQDGDDYGVFARHFGTAGLTDGPDIQVNTYVTGHQRQPAVAAIGGGQFIVAWESNSQTGAGSDLFGQLLETSGEPIAGKRLLVRNPPAGPARNRVVLVSRDPGIQTPQTLGEDPRCAPLGSGSVTAGGRLTVAGLGGSFSIDLPCSNWSANASGTRYRYRDTSNTTCRSVAIRNGRSLRVLCRGPQVDYALGAAQGEIGLALTTGAPTTGRRICAQFGPSTSATVVHDGSSGTVYKALDAAVPPACP
jgi:hypothetical protein